MRNNSGKGYRLTLGYRYILIAISVGMVLMCMLFIVAQCYASIDDYISDRVRSLNTSELYQASSSVDSNIWQMQSITRYIAANDELIQMVSRYDTGNFMQKIQMQKSIHSALGRSARMNSSILFMSIVTRENVVSTGWLPLYDLTLDDIDGVDEIAERLSAAGDQPVFYMPSEIKLAADAKTGLSTLFGLYGFCMNMMLDDERIGVVFLLANDNIFRDLLQRSPNKVVLDGAGTVLYNNTGRPDDYIRGLYDAPAERGGSPGDELLLIDSRALPISVGRVVESAELMDKTAGLRTFLLVFILGVAALTFIVANLLSRMVIRPLSSLVTKINEYNVLPRAGGSHFTPVKPHKISMAGSIMWYLLSTVALSVGVLIVAVQIFFSGIIDDYAHEAASSAVTQTSDNLAFYFDNARAAAENYLYDGMTQTIMSQPLSDNANELLQESMVDSLSLYQRQVSLLMFDGERRLLASLLTNGAREPSYLDAQFTSGQNYIYGAAKPAGNGVNYVPLYMKMSSVATFTVMGYLECRLGELDIESRYSSLMQDASEVFVCDSGGKIVSHPDKTLIGSAADIEGGAHGYMFAESRSIGDTGYYIVARYQESIVNYEKTRFRLVGVIMFIIAISAALLVALLAARKLPGYFSRLGGAVRSMEISNIGAEFTEGSRIDEVNQLTRAFNEMAARIEHLLDEVIVSTKRASVLEEMGRKSEVAALQAQINPHFLYNTLENIYWMVHKRHNAEALDMLEKLSAMLRFISRKDNITVTVSEEVEYARDYVGIMKSRYEDELTVIFDISPEIMDRSTIKLLLQPLIENAIYHGVRPTSRHGTIIVSGRPYGGGIEFTVEDDGAGMSEDELRELRRRLDNAMSPESIGLINVKTRLKLFYGDGYAMDIDAAKGMGCVITIRIPAARSAPFGDGRADDAVGC